MKVLQPEDVASQLAQTLSILHIDPEVAASYKEIHDVVWRDDNSKH